MKTFSIKEKKNSKSLSEVKSDWLVTGIYTEFTDKPRRYFEFRKYRNLTKKEAKDRFKYDIGYGDIGYGDSKLTKLKIHPYDSDVDSIRRDIYNM